MVDANILMPAKVKLAWSNYHIDRLKYFWDRYCNSEFARLEVVEDDRGNGLFRLRLVVDQLPADVPLLAGDAIHAMRCALDYAINAVYPMDSKLTFPFRETRKELEGTFSSVGLEGCNSCGRGRTKGPYAKVEKASPGIADIIIEKIRPYKDGNELLWVLNKLDVRDKHRLIVPAINIGEITGINGRGRGINMINCSIAVAAGNYLDSFPATDDFILHSFDKPRAELILQEDNVIEDEPLFDTLFRMQNAVCDAIKFFEVHLNRTTLPS